MSCSRLQNRKRQRADESSQPPPAKKAKLSRENNFLSEFWDNLSKVWLTPRALRELDRRNKAQSLPIFTVPKLYSTNLVRFARHGGPDLHHLRGFTEHESFTRDMSPSPPTQSTSTNKVVQRTKRSSAYDKDFQQHLSDHNIHPADHDGDNDAPQPENLAQVLEALRVERASLSPSHFPLSAFQDFKTKNAQATCENDVMRTLIPILTGDSLIHNQQDILFTELKPITNKGAVKPQPDFFDGARLGDLSQKVRKDQAIRSTGIPTKHPTVPVEPNFFLEVKGPNGNSLVVQRQACYHGAYGTRAMHTLQNYRETKPIYDGNAYTYSSTYFSGYLDLYAHYITAPTAKGQPEYHMISLASYGIRSDRETFIKGATAFRNLRDLAQRQRNSFLQAANVKAAQAEAAIHENTTTYQEDSSPLEIHESEDSQDANSALQQQIADASEEALHHDTVVESTASRYLYTEENAPNPSQESAALNDASMNFTPSFPTFTIDLVQPERSRDFISPPSTSKRTHSSQRRTEGRRTTRSSSQAKAPTSSGPGTSWVETYRRRGKVCFKDLNKEEIQTELKEWTAHVVDKTQCYYWQSAASQRSFWTTELPKEAKKAHRHRS